jgi:predicted RNA-binding Zn ribbon-like protein
MPVSAQNREFQLVAGHPALDLVNTLDWRFRASGPEELLAGYDDLLRFVVQSGLLKPKPMRDLLRTMPESGAAHALASCRTLREAASEVFYAAVEGHTPGAKAIRDLETIFKEARKNQHLAWDRFRLRWEWPSPDRDPELPVWMLTRCVWRLLLSSDMEFVRACENVECRWLFLDTSKNHTRRWCDMRLCGNRMKARRFKAQHRS